MYMDEVLTLVGGLLKFITRELTLCFTGKYTLHTCNVEQKKTHKKPKLLIKCVDNNY